MMSLYLTLQEEEMLKREKSESAHSTTSSQNTRKKTAENSSQNKKAKEQPMESTCFFCKKTEHMKNNCSKYTAWCERMGSLGVVCQVMLNDSSMWAMAIKLQQML